jgi:hypothetical protein
LARLNEGRYQQTFETDAGYGHEPYEPKAPKHTIHLEGAYRETINTGHRLGHKDPPRVRSRSRSRPTLTDLMGKFPVRSSKGNSYVMVCYVYDCNYVKVIPMKSRSASEWVKAYDTVHQELTVKGFKPKLQTLDNEASAALKNSFTVNDIAYQLVPPH